MSFSIESGHMSKKTIVAITLAAVVFAYALPANAQRKGRRMKQVDLLVLGGTLVSMDKERRIIPDAGVAVAGGRIVAVGSRKDIAAQYTAAQTVEANGK